MTFLEQAREKLRQIAQEHQWKADENVHIISARDLTPEEVIGKPDRDDYPLLTGKEVMMEARFRDGVGQAFTDQAGRFEGSLEDVCEMPLDTNFRRAVFVATLNAALRSLRKVEGTIHCKDREPALCAKELPRYLRQQYGQPKIAFVGYQPALIEALHQDGFTLRVSDKNPDNIGTVRCGEMIYDAALNREHVEWADVVLTTGSVLVNDSYHELQMGKPVIYYGVTAAGLASLFGFPRICFYGR